MNKMLFVAMTFAVGLAHAGDLYRWTDAQGVLHVSDTPPPPSEVNPTRLQVDRNKINEADSTLYAPPKPQSGQKQEGAQNQPATANAQNAQNAQAANTDSRSNCERVRANVQLLEGSRPVADSYGKVLDEKSRADMLEQARRVAESCK